MNLQRNPSSAILMAIVYIMLFSFSSVFASVKEEIYVRVYFQNQEQKSFLLSSDLMFLDIGKDYVDIIVSNDEIKLLQDKEFRVEVLYNSSSYYFEKLLGKSWADSFHTYSQVASEMEQAAGLYSNIMKLDTLGFSVQGRAILAAKISLFPPPNDLAKFRIMGLHHGDELMSAEIPLAMMHHLLSNYGVLPEVTDLVNNRVIWIIPMVNPDGRMAIPSPTRVNVNGVDLNRDYGYMWGGQGYSPSPFSQPETKAIRENGLKNNFVLSLSFHTYGNVINYLWNYTPHGTPDDSLIYLYSNRYSSFNGYWVTEGYDWYQTYGDANDWSYGSCGDVDWTMEVANSNFSSVWDANRDAILDLIKKADRGLKGRIRDATTGASLEGKITILPLKSFAFSDSSGFFHKVLLPGVYDIKCSASGYLDTIIENITVTDTGATQINISLLPNGKNSASRIVSCFFYDPFSYPNDYQNNPTNAFSLLGFPDSEYASLGKGGFITVDFSQTPIVNGGGTDFTVYEDDNPREGYNVYWSNQPWGPWHFLANGLGTTSFDINSTGVHTIRYLKIVDDNDGSATEQFPGCDLDAIVSAANFLCGDANWDGIVDIGDVTFLIDYVFYSGKMPKYSEYCDVNSDEIIDIGDIVYLISYIFYFGTAPYCS